jgi:hypothetical protein
MFANRHLADDAIAGRDPPLNSTRLRAGTGAVSLYLGYARTG